MGRYLLTGTRVLKFGHDKMTQDSMSLGQLNGAILKWEDKDGNVHKVEFGD